MSPKIFITGINEINKLEIAKDISKMLPEYKISKTFTTDKEYIYDNSKNMYYIDIDTISLSFKNNALLYISTTDDVSNGITIDDFYANDIFILGIEEFNMIPEKIFDNYDILVIWADTSKHEHFSNSEINETKYLIERLDNITNLYFLNECSIDISNVVARYINGDEYEKNRIIYENS